MKFGTCSQCYEYKYLIQYGECYSCLDSIELELIIINNHTKSRRKRNISTTNISIKEYQFKDMKTDLNSWLKTESREFIVDIEYPDALDDETIEIDSNEKYTVTVKANKDDYVDTRHRQGFKKSCKAVLKQVADVAKR